MKRIFREASEQTKSKMSIAHVGKCHSEATKQKISQSMTKYWQSVPSGKDLKPTTVTTNTDNFNPYV